MVLYGNQGHFREAGWGGQSQILDPTCSVYFRNTLEGRIQQIHQILG